MKVLLLSPPFEPYYMRNARCDFVSLSGAQWYPILLGYCGAWLEKKGFEIKFMDCPTYGLDKGGMEKVVKEFKPEWIILYSGRLSEDNDIDIGDMLCEKYGCQIVIVGPYASISPEKTLQKSRNIKFLLTGEFELPVGDLLGGMDYSRISNLLYKKDNIFVQNTERPYLVTEELDRIPFLSRFFKKHLDPFKYKSVSEYYPYLDILTGRGCQWGRCTYCLWVHSYIKGPVYNCRSIDNVIEELSYISYEMPEIKSIMIQDDTLTEERAVELSQAILKAGIKVSWSCYGRGNMSYDVLKSMKQAGCLNLHVGFESADPHVLSNIKKGVTKERMTRFAKEAHQAGLRIHGDFAIGFPGETLENIQKTIDWACEIRPHTAQFQLMIPFPGTPFYDELNEKGWLTNGLPDYPHTSAVEMEKMSKKAYRSFYISVPFLKDVIKHPNELFFSRLKVYLKAIPAVFWKAYVR